MQTRVLFHNSNIFKFLLLLVFMQLQLRLKQLMKMPVCNLSIDFCSSDEAGRIEESRLPLSDGNHYYIYDLKLLCTYNFKVEKDYSEELSKDSRIIGRHAKALLKALDNPPAGFLAIKEGCSYNIEFRLYAKPNDKIKSLEDKAE